MIRLHTLGALDLRASEEEGPASSVLAQPRRVALLAYLALARPPGGLVPRDALLAVFWPEYSDERARRALNQALYYLRKRLGTSALVSQGGRVGLSSDVWCDAVAFQCQVEKGRLLEALELYRGELLPAFHIQDAPDFGRWLDEERARLQALALEAATGAARECAADGNPVEAVRWLRRAREFAPYDEGLMGELARALAGAGDRTGLVQEWQAFRDRLWTDLELEPSPALEKAIAGLEVTPAVVEPVPGPAPAETVRPSGGAARPARSLALTATLVLFLTAMVLLALATRSDVTGLLDQDRILVADFTNLSDDPEHEFLGRVVADWLIQDLAEAGVLLPVSLATMLREDRRLIESGEARDAQGWALALAEQTGAGLLLTGSIHEAEGRVLLRGQVIRVEDGRVLRTVEGSSVLPDDGLMAVRDLSHKLLGSLATLVDPRMASWSGNASQPTDLEAYRLYAAGLNAYLEARRDEALRLLLAAGAPEAGFTAPLLWAIRVSTDMNRMDRADSILTVLEPWRPRLRRWDAAMFDYYAGMVRGRWEDMVGPAERLVAAAPDSEWLLALASVYLQTNRPAAALAVHQRLDPDRGWIREVPYHWSILADARHRLGDYEGELADLERWRTRNPSLARTVELRALGALGHMDIFRERLEAFLEEAPVGAKTRLLETAMDELAAHGRAAEAAGLRARLDSMLAGGVLDGVEDEVRRARLLSRVGRWDEASALLWPRTDEGAHVRARLGQIAASRGDRDTALRMAARLDSVGGKATQGWATMERAMIHALLNDRETSLALMKQAMEEGHGYYSWLHFHPAFANLRGWPPYEAFMEPRN